VTPPITPTVTPAPTPTATPTVTPAPSGSLILTAADVEVLGQRIATGAEPYASAWAFFRDGKVRSAMSATPNVDVGPTAGFSYTQLDTDSRHARNAAVAYACTGSSTYAAKARQFVLAWAQANHPAPYSFTNDYQGGYHQAFGAFSFAFAYDLTEDSGAYSSAEQTTIKAWFRTWATVMKGYQDNYAKDYWFTHTGRGTYDWPGSKLTYDQTDFYTGRDTAAAPAAAWLACAVVGEDPASISTLYNQSYTLNVPAILHCASAPDNEGDGRSQGAAPQVLVKAAGYYDNSSRGGCVDYMSYNARIASMLYQMTASLGRATDTMRSELRASWVYLSQFSGPGYLASPAPNDLVHWDLELARIQSAAHIYGEQQFLDDVNGGQFPRAQFYESQFLGPTTLTQF
jgi:Alginate lyase